MASSAIPRVAGLRSFFARSREASERQSYGTYLRRRWPWYIMTGFYGLLALLATVYGFVLGLSGGLNLVPFFLPLALLAAVAIWVMPGVRYPPIRLARTLLTATLFLYLCWPDYIALALPGLPWITALRLTCIPLTVVLLICAFGSKPFRKQVADIAQGDKVVVGLFVFYVAYCGLSIFFSTRVSDSASKYWVLLYSGLVPFFVALYLFNTPGRVRVFAYYLYFIAMFSLIIGFYETRNRHLPWATGIPSFLKIQDPRVISLLQGSARAAGGKYRVQSKFSTAIGLGEYLGFALPFMLHLVFTEKNKLVRIAIGLSIPLALYVTLETDSRLAFICFVSSILLYILYQSFKVWREQKSNIFAPAIMMAYPVFMAMFMVLALVWRRLSNLVFGGGAAQFSTMSRHIQWERGIPKVLSQPWGHGLGNGAKVLGYYIEGATDPTIDSFYLTVLLDVGIIGFAAFFGMFALASVRSAWAALMTRDSDTLFLAACCVAMTNFLVSKYVYAQMENHPLAYVVLGMSVALLRRYKTETGELPPPPTEDVLYPPTVTDYAKDWERRHTWAT